MLLIGRDLSPFVRRTATVIEVLGLPYERRKLATADAPEAVAEFNPLARVPALVLEDGEVLIDSAAIIDYLLEIGDPDRRNWSIRRGSTISSNRSGTGSPIWKGRAAPWLQMVTCGWTRSTLSSRTIISGSCIRTLFPRNWRRWPRCPNRPTRCLRFAIRNGNPISCGWSGRQVQRFQLRQDPVGKSFQRSHDLGPGLTFYSRLGGCTGPRP